MLLHGVYDLAMVSLVVQPFTIGVYALSGDGRHVDYVGRSDSDLPARIRQSANAGLGYRHFWFDYASSPTQACRYECGLFHYYDPPRNTNHPTVPPGARWRCPMAGCT